MDILILILILITLVLFRASPGCHWAHSPVDDQGGSGEGMMPERANWGTPVGIDMDPKLSFSKPGLQRKRELELELELELQLELVLKLELKV